VYDVYCFFAMQALLLVTIYHMFAICSKNAYFGMRRIPAMQ
jgi:hypothetical protein